MLILELAIIVLLTVLNGVLAMSELAIVSSRTARLRQAATRGGRGARAALRLMEEPSRFLATVQIGITLIGILAGAYGGTTLAARLAPWLDSVPGLEGQGGALALGVVVAAITYLSLVVGELVPKRIALRNAERVAATVARPMRLISTVAAPLAWFLGASTDLILRLLGLHGEREATVTEDEVRSLITEGTRAGIFDPREKEMIEGVLRLADRSVRAVMTPRPDVVWLDVADPPEAIREEIRTSRFSRFPVCRGDLDEVLGIVQTKDLLDAALAGRPLDLVAAAVPALVVHDGTPLLQFLDLVKESGTQMAVVVDEYGSVEGIVTVVDALETVAGELPEPGSAEEPEVVRRADGSWLVDGAVPVDELEDRIGLSGLKGRGDYHTLAGFVLHALGRIPAVGDGFERSGVRFEVVDMDGRRIDRVLIVPPPEGAEGERED